jgi:hypothetical protein
MHCPIMAPLLTDRIHLKSARCVCLDIREHPFWFDGPLYHWMDVCCAHMDRMRRPFAMRTYRENAA